MKKNFPMQKFVEHLIKNKIVYVLNVDAENKTFYGIDPGSKTLEKKDFSLTEYEDPEDAKAAPKLADICLSLRPAHYYNTDPATQKAYNEIKGEIAKQRQLAVRGMN